MGKIIIFTILESEEQILSDIQRYLHSKADYIDISSKQEIILSFPDLEIDLYRREARQNQKVIRLADLEFQILHYLASQPGRAFITDRFMKGSGVRDTLMRKGPSCSISVISGKSWN